MRLAIVGEHQHGRVVVSQSGRKESPLLLEFENAPPAAAVLDQYAVALQFGIPVGAHHGLALCVGKPLLGE